MSDYQDLIDKLGAAALDARTAIREAHEAKRDLEEATSRAKITINTLMHDSVQGRIDMVVENRLTMFGNEVRCRQQEIFQKVETETEKLLTLILGKRGTDKDLRPLLQQAAERIAAYEALHQQDDRLRGKLGGNG